MISASLPVFRTYLAAGTTPAPAPASPAPSGQPLPQPPPDIQNRPQPAPPGPPPPLPNGAQPATPSQPTPAPAPAPANGSSGQPQTTTITRTYSAPVEVSTQLGGIPNDYFQWTWGWGGWGGGTSSFHPIGGPNNDFGPVPVVRNVPQQNPDGTPKMHDVTETLSATTYSQQKRSIGYGFAGLAAGVGGAAITGFAMGSHLGPIGMIAGGLVGGLGGALLGYKTAQGDKIQEKWETENIEKPTMTGYTEYLQPSYHTEEQCHEERGADGQLHQECYSHQELDGYWHQFSPDIQWTNLGTYQRPTLVHTAPIGTVGGGAIAIGAGLAVGLGIGALAAVL